VSENTVAGLKSPDEYRADRAHIFPSPGSLEWFVRRHRERLIDKGALLVIAGRTQIDPSAFDQTVLEVGASEAESARRGRRFASVKA
jgi:hypothetical protein